MPRLLRGLRLIALAAIVLSFGQPARAATRVKQNNTTNLNLAGSWDVLPGASDIAQWNSVVTAANSTALGADLRWNGIQIDSPGGTVTVNSGNTLSLGASGIYMNNATRDLTLNCALTVQGQQTWGLNANRTLTLAGTFTHSGAVVNFSTWSTSRLNGLSNDASGILGPWATYGNDPATPNYATTTAGAISAFTTQTAGTAGSLANLTNPNLNYSQAGAITLTNNITANTLRYTDVATLNNIGYSMTLNGLMFAGDRWMTFGNTTAQGGGDIVIGANRELVIIGRSGACPGINPRIVNNSGGDSSLTVYGANSGEWSFNGASTYTGVTILNSFEQINMIASSFGTGPITVNGSGPGNGRLSVRGNPNPNPLTLNGGTLMDSFVWTGPVALVGSNTCIGYDGTSGTISGPLGGGGGFSKQGTCTLTLSGPCTYTGATSVAAGTLACATAYSLGQGALDITTGATVQLNYAGTRRVTTLTFNAGSAQPNGTYGSSSSPATNKNDACFAGTGTLTVGPPGATTTTTLALTSGSTPAAVGSSLTFTATVAGSAPGGSVRFYDGGALLGTGALNGAFQAAVTTTSLGLGSHPITALYLGDAANEASVSASLPVLIANPADILSFTFPGLPATTIAGTTVGVTVPYATDVTALAPTYTVSAGATGDPVSGTARNFTTAQTYSITGQGTTKVYTVTVTKAAASSAKDITAFVFPGQAATTIAGTNITLTVPFGTAVTSLAPTYTVSALAVQDPAFPSGSARDFTSAKTYTIRAEDNSTKTYTVTVTVAASSPAKDMLTCDFGALGAATISGTSAVLTVPPNQAVTGLAPTFTISPLATLSPVSGSTHDFTNPVSYTVTAQNGSTLVYMVAVQSYQTWAHSGSLFILTTPDGANLTAAASEANFPLLVRLSSGNFDFSQAQPDGRDIRFTTAASAPLSYQIEEWDALNGSASVWVKIPVITGNARQEIKMYWGKTGVASQSSAAAVFNAANGYVCVMHLSDALNPVQDDVGNLSPTNLGTTSSTGMIGKGRHFAGNQGVDCGESIMTFPTGSNPHSTSGWVKAAQGNSRVIAWGYGDQLGPVQLIINSGVPPHYFMDCWYSGGSVTGTKDITLAQWYHLEHTYKNGESRLYVNGVLDATTTGGTPMNIQTPEFMVLGGQPGNYPFIGDIDEVRISNVTRSADWVKLEYQNQNPLQSLVGTLVQGGTAFAVSPPTVTTNENTTISLTAQAGGAQKYDWILKQGGQDTVLAVDQLSLSLPAGRVTGNQSYVIEFKAIYPTETKTFDVPVTVVDSLPDPLFTLTAPAIWDGRQTINITPNISNLAALQAAGVATLNYTWSATGVAVIKQITPGTLTLTRSQGSGPLTVSLVLDNGGALVSSSKTIVVQEPATDAWVQRTPDATEKPLTGQFYARDDTGKGRIYYNGTQAGASAVFLKVYSKPETGAEIQYGTTLRQTLTGGGAYAFTAPIDAGKFTYRVEFGTTAGGTDTVSATATDLVCGDAYIIDGQSNAVAYDYYNQAATYPDIANYTSTWIRTHGTAEGTTIGDWGLANTTSHFIGFWGLTLARNLLDTYGIPICIINGAVGGTLINQHQANPANHYDTSAPYSIYANLINRVAAAKLTHGIRGALWHQGEADLSNWGNTGDWDYKSYQQNFVNMSAAWKQDMPNLKYYYLFQVFAKGCGASGTFTSDMLRDVQRTLPLLYSHMSIVPTLAFATGANCHFNLPDYALMGLSMAPLVARDNYGLVPAAALTGPNLQQAWFTTASKNEIALQFDQTMAWNAASIGNFYLDRIAGSVTSGSVSGKIVKLQLNGASTNLTIDYVVDQYWDGTAANLLYGTNGIAALSFYAVPIAASAPSAFATWAADPAQALAAGVNNGPMDDPDHDGIPNLLEFALGGKPMVPARSILPALTNPAGTAWVFEYDRNVLARPPATTQVLEYGSDLTGWTPLTIPLTSSGNVTITPGSASDHVKVTLSGLGAKAFVRLRVSQ